MRIGLVTPAWPGHAAANGIATAVMHLRNGLEALGHQVSIIALDAGVETNFVFRLPPARSLRFGERIIMRLGRPWLYQSILADQIARAAQAAVQRRGIEALIMEETWGWSAEVQAMLEIPVVTTLHGPWLLHKSVQASKHGSKEDAAREAREAAGLHASAGITAPSGHVFKDTEAALGPFGAPTAIIPNPIAVGEPPDHRALGEKECRSLLFVGRYDRHKGGDLVLDAFSELIDRGIDARLTFVGPDRGVAMPGGRLQSLEEKLSLMPLAARERIDIRGLQEKSQVEALRRRHKIAIIASRYENLNYTLLEAMSAGMAIVSTNVGGPAEILHHDRTGLLVTPDSSIDLANSLEQVLEFPETAECLGYAAWSDAQARFSPEVVAKKTVDFLQRTSKI